MNHRNGANGVPSNNFFFLLAWRRRLIESNSDLNEFVAGEAFSRVVVPKEKKNSPAMKTFIFVGLDEIAARGSSHVLNGQLNVFTKTHVQSKMKAIGYPDIE